MNITRLRTSFILFGLAATCFAQPKLVRFTGTLERHVGRTTASTESVTLAVYREQSGGAPLWQEAQNIEVDQEGRYSVLMGSTLTDGMPMDLFAAGEPRWLGVQVNRPGEVEQPRVLMVSVPYALKASDSDTLGGRPASAYLLANGAAGSVTSPGTGTVASTTAPTNAVKPRVNSGTPGFIGVFTNATDLGNSVMQQANGTIGVGTVPGANASTVPSLDLRTNPFSQIGMAQTTDYLTFFASDSFGPAIYWNPGKDLRFGKGGTGLYNAFGFAEQMRIQSSTGNLGIGTQSPGSKLDVAGDINFTGNLRRNGSAFVQLPAEGTSIGVGISAYPHVSGSGTQNTALGTNALASDTNGQGNTAVGNGALLVNTIGNSNTAVGAAALTSNLGGINNTAVGAGGLGQNRGGSNNTAIGVSTMQLNTTGNENIAIGFLAGSNITTESDNILIGNPGLAGDSKAIRIGSPGPGGSFFAGGIFGTTTSNNDAIPVVVDINGQLGTVVSSRRFKEDIADMGDASAGLMQLRPVTYRYKQPYADGSKPVQYGLIAEEVAEVYPDLVAHSADGQIETVKYQVLDSMLLNEVQRQQAEIKLLKDQVVELKSLMESTVRQLTQQSK